MGAIKDILDEFGRETVRIIQTNMASAGQNASGQTSSEINYEATDERVTVSGPSHVFVLETGRGPGKQPPIGVIPQWINDKRLSLTGPVENAAFAISRIIGEKGTKLFQMGGRKDIITPAVDDSRIDTLSRDVADVEFDKVLKVIDVATNRK